VKNTHVPTRKDLNKDREEEDDDKDPEGFDPENLKNELEVDGDPEIVTVKIKTKTSNEVRIWELRELTVPRRSYYMNKLKNHMERDGETIKDFKGLQESLLTEVCYENDEPVPRAEIEGLPTKAIDLIYLRASYMNGLDKGAGARAKKRLSKTES
jgi:hypothetical protein